MLRAVLYLDKKRRNVFQTDKEKLPKCCGKYSLPRSWLGRSPPPYQDLWLNTVEYDYLFRINLTYLACNRIAFFSKLNFWTLISLLSWVMIPQICLLVRDIMPFHLSSPASYSRYTILYFMSFFLLSTLENWALANESLRAGGFFSGPVLCQKLTVEFILIRLLKSDLLPLLSLLSFFSSPSLLSFTTSLLRHPLLAFPKRQIAK